MISNGLMAQLTAEQCKQKGDEKIKHLDYDAAMKYYQFGINQNPDKADIYNNMGNIYTHFSSYSEAVKYYDQAIAKDPHNLAAHHNRAFCYYHLGNMEKAKKNFEISLLLDTTAASIFGMAMVYYELDSFDLAREYVDIAIELNQSDYQYFLLKAKVLDKTTENREEVLVQYDRALSLKPDLPEIYIERAEMLDAWGEHKAAKYDYKTAKGLEKIHVDGSFHKSESMIVYL